MAARGLPDREEARDLALVKAQRRYGNPGAPRDGAD